MYSYRIVVCANNKIFDFVFTFFIFGKNTKDGHVSILYFVNCRLLVT